MSSHSSGPESHLSQERRAVLDESVKVGEDFIRLYYKTLEQRPHRVHQLYLEASVMIWDGNPQIGPANVQKFFEDLPSLTFNIASMDSQRIASIAVAQKSFIINATGNYRSSGSGAKGFLQSFVVTADNGKWKVASDIFRTQVSPNQALV